MAAEELHGIAEVLDVLALDGTEARTTEDIFTARSQIMPHHRVYGGQVLAQTVLAASRTVDDDRVIHSMHGYFLRPGDDTQGVTLAVDRIHDGRSFSTRRTQVFQQGVPIFSMIASFQRPSDGKDHQIPFPQGVPHPDEVPEVGAVVPGLEKRFARQPDFPFHIRAIPDDPADPRAEQYIWIKTREPLPDDPMLHRAVFAYLSDMTVQDAILREHGILWNDPGLKMASLDHAMWWHRQGRADEWMLCVQNSPSAQGGRGLTQGRIYSHDGALLVSIAQEVMLRTSE